MKIAVRIAQAGNQILNIIVMGIILFLFLYGGYSLWDTYMSAKSAFLSDDLLSYKPQPGEGANPSLEDLMAINKDVAGWITIDDTHIARLYREKMIWSISIKMYMENFLYQVLFFYPA